MWKCSPWEILGFCPSQIVRQSAIGNLFWQCLLSLLGRDLQGLSRCTSKPGWGGFTLQPAAFPKLLLLCFILLKSYLGTAGILYKHMYKSIKFLVYMKCKFSCVRVYVLKLGLDLKIKKQNIHNGSILSLQLNAERLVKFWLLCDQEPVYLSMGSLLFLKWGRGLGIVNRRSSSRGRQNTGIWIEF